MGLGQVSRARQQIAAFHGSVKSYHVRYGVTAGVARAYKPPCYAQAFRGRGRPVVQDHLWSARFDRADFDIGPRDAVTLSRPQSLQDGFFGREPPGQTVRTVRPLARVSQLPSREAAREKMPSG